MKVTIYWSDGTNTVLYKISMVNLIHIIRQLTEGDYVKKITLEFNNNESDNTN